MSKKTQTDSYSHILKYTGFFGGVQGIVILVGVVRNKLVASILGPTGVGLVSLFNSTIKMLSDAVNLGTPTSAVKSVSAAYDHASEAETAHTVAVVRNWTLLLALLGTALCVVLSPFLSWFTFSWNGHIFHFICLSPMVGLSIMTGGEMAVLKGMRQLRSLASISVYSVLAALVISVPIYYFFDDAGIVPSLVLMALASMLITIRYSFRLFPFHFRLQKDLLLNGLPMIKLGIAFGIALLFGSLTDFLIRSYVNNVSGIEAVGLYNAGIMMTWVYVTTIFSSMETDYFPRLSGIPFLGTTFNTTVNRQIEVMVLLASPMLVGFMLFLPLLLPLLYTSKFMAALGMMQVVVLAMFFRAVKLPVEYIPLARGDSKSYILLEGLDQAMMLVLVVVFYGQWGLKGAGFAFLISAVADMLLVFIYARWHYGYKPTKMVVAYSCMQIPAGFLIYAVTYISNPWLYWILGSIVLVASSLVSLKILRAKTHLWEALVLKIKGRLHG